MVPEKGEAEQRLVPHWDKFPGRGENKIYQHTYSPALCKSCNKTEWDKLWAVLEICYGTNINLIKAIKTSSNVQSSTWEFTSHPASQEIPCFMLPKDSLSRSQEPGASIHHGPGESSSHCHTLFLEYNFNEIL